MNAPRSLFSRTTHGSLWRCFALTCLLSQSAITLAHGAGTVIAWGANDANQCVIPVGLSNVVAVAGGVSHSLALVNNGGVIAWGFNASGQTTVPATATNGVVAISGGSTYSLAFKTNGTIVVFGSLPSQPPGLTNLLGMAAGWTHALALKPDGTVVAWGQPGVPAATNIPPTVTNVIAVAAGNNLSVALRADGTVVAWGDNGYGQTNVPPGATNVMAVAAGGYHCLALRRDGTIVGWGRNTDLSGNVVGQATNLLNLNNAIAIGAGALHSIALRADGTLAAWGDNNAGPGQTNINQSIPGFIGLAAGGYHSLAIKGDNNPVILIQPLSQVVSISKSVTLQVVAAGAPTLTYQWQYNGTNISGATGSTLTLANFQATKPVTNIVVVANAYGSITSTPAILIPNAGPPFVTAPLQNQTNICGDSASFAVSVDGSGPFTYQWKFNGTAIANATQSSLVLSSISKANEGTYSVIVSNATGSVTTNAYLAVLVQPPLITSPGSASGVQGGAFSYTITALHTNGQRSFSAMFLPNGLNVNSGNGVISGVPTENGTFNALITAFNACTSYTTNLLLTISSSVPVITSPLNASGVQGTPFTYQITATFGPTSYSAQNLPIGLLLNPNTGLISGTPTYSGDVFTTIAAANVWGTGSAVVHFTFTDAAISGLAIANLGYVYRTPYLLDFPFTLRDPNASVGIVTQPSNITVQAYEDYPDMGMGTFYLTNNGTGMIITDTNASMVISAINPVEETGLFISPGSGKVQKTYLVLDFTDSVADPALNGGPYPDGTSFAVSNEVAGAQYFVNQQPAGAQVGAYEFHRDDEAPNNILDPVGQKGLTKNKGLLDGAIAGIWTNFVQGFYAGSRCWDAVDAAILALGAPNVDEQHYVVFISDGNDYSSTATPQQIITDARGANVQVYCIAFGQNPDIATLQQIALSTRGRFFQAQNPVDLFQQFALVSKDVQAQYILRWATLRRAAPAPTLPLDFLPDFKVTYQNFSASPAFWSSRIITLINTDTNNPPTYTNSYILWTSPSLAPYDPPAWAGTVTSGTLRLIPDDEVHPSGVTLRSTYTPRWIRQVRIHYRANWPCTTFLQSTNAGEALYGWSVTETSDGAGGKFALLSSPNPNDQSTAVPFAWFGSLLTFQFKDSLNLSNAFSFISVDNSIYTNIVAGGQTLAFDNTTNTFITSYPDLLHHTPVPWIIGYGLASASAGSNGWQQAELADTDLDGMANWQEYIANTIPTNAASVFKLVSVVRQSDGRFQITFTTSTNRTYAVQSSTNLFNWQTVQSGIPGVNANVTVTDPAWFLGKSIFYRALVY
jgi:hypothetical protein